MGESFQFLARSSMRAWKRRSCSTSDTENQYFTSWIPDRSSIRSNSGTARRNSQYSASVQNPITRSTPARLYQERSNSTISPAVGRWVTYRWKYHCPRSRSVGVGRAVTRQNRGLRGSEIRLIVPPLPAASLPSKRMTTLWPLSRIQSSNSGGAGGGAVDHPCHVYPARHTLASSRRRLRRRSSRTCRPAMGGCVGEAWGPDILRKR